VYLQIKTHHPKNYVLEIQTLDFEIQMIIIFSKKPIINLKLFQSLRIIQQICKTTCGSNASITSFLTHITSLIFSAKRHHDPDHGISIAYENNHIADSSHTKFLGIHITDMLSWKKHIDQLFPKLSSAC
jgi:hypothetical protein